MTRIVSWNMHQAVIHDMTRRDRAWAHLATLAPDIALVQEAAPTAGSPANVVWAAGDDIPAGWREARAGVAGYGVAVRAFDGPIHPSYYGRRTSFTWIRRARPGTLALAEASLDGGEPLLLASLYGAIGYAEQSVAWALADIMPMFDDTQCRDHIVVGGDLNIHTHTTDRRSRHRAKALLDLAESAGMVNLLRYAKERGLIVQGERATPEPCSCDGSDCYHVKTHRGPGQRLGEMAANDYLFASRTLAARLVSLTVMNGDDSPEWTHSDHCPLVADFSV